MRIKGDTTDEPIVGGKTRGFMSSSYKKIPVTMRDHLKELTPAEWMVWSYVNLRTGKEGEAFPSNQTIADETGMHRETVKTAKKGLRTKGYFVKQYQRRREDGMMSTVVEKTCLPWMENPATDVEKGSHGTVAQKNGGGKKQPTEVDTLNLEVAPSAIQDFLEVPPLTGGVRKEESETLAVLASPATPQEKATQLTSEEKATPKSTPVELTGEEEELLNVLMPLHNLTMESDSGVKTDLGNILTLCSGWDINPYDLLAYNRAHKKGGLYIRTPEDYAKALAGNEDGTYHLVNEYMQHDPRDCKLCKEARNLKCRGYAQNKIDFTALPERKRLRQVVRRARNGSTRCILDRTEDAMTTETKSEVIYLSGESEALGAGWDVMQVVFKREDGGNMRVANSAMIARDASGKIIRKTDILLDRWEVVSDEELLREFERRFDERDRLAAEKAVKGIIPSFFALCPYCNQKVTAALVQGSLEKLRTGEGDVRLAHPTNDPHVGDHQWTVDPQTRVNLRKLIAKAQTPS